LATTKCFSAVWTKVTVGFYRKIRLPVITEQHGPDEVPHYALDFGDVHFGFIEVSPKEWLERGESGATQFEFAVDEDPDGLPIQFTGQLR